MKFFIKSRLYSYTKCTTKPHFVFFPTVVFRCAFCFPHGKSCLNHFIFHFQMIKIYLADLQKQFLDFINNFYRNSPAILSIILLEQSFDLVKNCLFLFNRRSFLCFLYFDVIGTDCELYQTDVCVFVRSEGYRFIIAAGEFFYHFVNGIINLCVDVRCLIFELLCTIF